MSMYECKQCGEDHATMPGVFLAVNTIDPVFPYHRTEFEIKLGELWEDTGKYHYDPKGWEKFWSWLGDNKIEWFCCKKCAIEFLQKQLEEETCT